MRYLISYLSDEDLSPLYPLIECLIPESQLECLFRSQDKRRNSPGQGYPVQSDDLQDSTPIIRLNEEINIALIGVFPFSATPEQDDPGSRGLERGDNRDKFEECCEDFYFADNRMGDICPVEKSPPPLFTKNKIHLPERDQVGTRPADTDREVFCNFPDIKTLPEMSPEKYKDFEGLMDSDVQIFEHMFIYTNNNISILWKKNISLSCGEPSSKGFLKLLNVPIVKANPLAREITIGSNTSLRRSKIRTRSITR